MASERHKRRLFPGMVFGLIGMNVCIVGITIGATRIGGGAFSVEADYDRKALRWDEEASQIRHNAALGWVVLVDSTGGGTLRVRLLDRAGRGLEGASVRVEAFHHAHSARKIAATMTPVEPGVYEGKAALQTPGLWELRFVVGRGPERFTQSITQSITRTVSESAAGAKGAGS